MIVEVVVQSEHELLSVVELHSGDPYVEFLVVVRLLERTRLIKRVVVESGAEGECLLILVSFNAEYLVTLTHRGLFFGVLMEGILGVRVSRVVQNTECLHFARDNIVVAEELVVG